MSVQGKSIYVGLSGGVDSAVCALLLQQAGARVTGVFIQGWYPPGMPCTWEADRRDAMRVAARLRIPFETLDASVEYKRAVIDYLLAEYRAGRTPNPDVMCNREVKFGAFLRHAKARGAEAIATGHYARILSGSLMRGSDAAKDQSYFLWAVPQTVLPDSLFPLGEMHKRAVRALAAQARLPVADKRDSQGVCFLGAISVEDFLAAEVSQRPGRAVDEEGREIGWHEGVLSHTLGERVGLAHAVSPGPWYVRAKKIAENELVVGKARAVVSGGHAVRFSGANWFGESREAAEAQLRYHGPLVRGRVSGESFMPEAALPEAPAPGQSIVFYRGEKLIGGGIIQ